MRKLALIITILALSSCVLGVDVIPNIQPEAYEAAMTLMTEVFPEWVVECTEDPESMLPIFEEIADVFGEAFQQRARVVGTRLYNAVRSRFVGEGARLTRQQVVQALGQVYEAGEVEMVGQTTTAWVAADAGLTEATASATAEAAFEVIGIEAVEAGATLAIDFSVEEVLIVLVMCLL